MVGGFLPVLYPFFFCFGLSTKLPAVFEHSLLLKFDALKIPQMHINMARRVATKTNWC